MTVVELCCLVEESLGRFGAFMMRHVVYCVPDLLYEFVGSQLRAVWKSLGQRIVVVIVEDAREDHFEVGVDSVRVNCSISYLFRNG